MAYDDVEVEVGQAFAGIAIVTGLDGLISVAQIWNPSDSGVNGYVDRILAAGTSPTWDYSGDMRVTQYLCGDLEGAWLNKRFGSPPGHLQLRDWHVVPTGLDAALGLNNIHEMWYRGCNDGPGYIFQPALLIPPGWGLALSSGRPASGLIISVQGREKPVV